MIREPRKIWKWEAGVKFSPTYLESGFLPLHTLALIKLRCFLQPTWVRWHTCHIVLAVGRCSRVLSGGTWGVCFSRIRDVLVSLLSFLVCIFVETSGQLQKNESDDTEHLAEKHGCRLRLRWILWYLVEMCFCTWRKGWLKKTPLPSVSWTEFSAVCMSASLTKTVLREPVTTIRTDMTRSIVLSPIFFGDEKNTQKSQNLHYRFTTCTIAHHNDGKNVVQKNSWHQLWFALPRMGLSSLLPLSPLLLLSRLFTRGHVYTLPSQTQIK